MSKYTLEAIDEMSGFGKSNFIKWPFIKFSATTRGIAPVGTFTKLSGSDELKAELLGKKINVVILHRGKFRLKNAELISSEVASSKEQVDIFTKEKSKLCDHGDYKEMKERYKLNTHQFPYVILNGQDVARMAVLPGSLQRFWEYLDTFKSDERPMYFQTIVSAGAEKKSKGGTYFEMAFTRGEKITEDKLDIVLDVLAQLDSDIKKNELTRAKKEREYINQHEGIDNLEERPMIKSDDIEISEDGEVIESET